MWKKLPSRQLQVLLLLVLLLSSLVLMLSILGCSSFRSTPSHTQLPLQVDEVSQEEIITAQPSLTPQPSPAPTATNTPVQVLAPEPIQIVFQAADGQELSGFYYPAAENPAPVIVLMGWARGDQDEWDPIARWLQGRGLLVREPDYNRSWKSSEWFPERTLPMPLGVMTFNFRNCEGGCQAYQPAEWLLDARAAMETAAGLPGVDPDRIIAAGTSIGADGAVSGCAWLNSTGLGTCQGSFSISPASFLTEAYEDSARALMDRDPALPVYCLFGLRDDASAETCEGLEGARAENFGYTDDHGFELIKPGQDPDPLQLLQLFIQEAVEEIE